MDIAFLSSEVFPFAKTGGLADVSGALPFALARAGCKVKIIMPLYKNIKPQTMHDDFGVTSLGKGIEIVFIRHDEYFLRDGLYGIPGGGDYPDNLERFSFYCRKSLELLQRMEFVPDIVHANDWQASLANIYLKIKEKDGIFFRKTKTILTVHNLAYQGLFEKEKFPHLGIAGEYFSLHFLEFYGKINLLKGGIVFSDMVNTVSPTYAEQIRTKEYGCGLEEILQAKGECLKGILNAIDYHVWDPAQDKLIHKTYGSESLADKQMNKKALQKETGLEQDPGKFLLGIVTRLAEQKGIDILAKALEGLLGKYQLIVLGTGDQKYHRILKEAQKKYPGALSLHLTFDETLAHKIYASCDAFLMPSRFEPCGLSQMISYKYATVPIVHKTGGLVDTVIDYEQDGGGFIFDRYRGQDLLAVIDRAYEVFSRPKTWSKLREKITSYNFSWEKTAQGYITMYQTCQSSQ